MFHRCKRSTPGQIIQGSKDTIFHGSPTLQIANYAVVIVLNRRSIIIIYQDWLNMETEQIVAQFYVGLSDTRTVSSQQKKKVAGSSVTVCLFRFSASTFQLVSFTHPSSCSYPGQQLHIAALSPPPTSSTKMTFTIAQPARRWERQRRSGMGRKKKKGHEKMEERMWGMKKKRKRRAKMGDVIRGRGWRIWEEDDEREGGEI